DFRHLALWNFIERSRGYIRFHARKGPEQRPVRSMITIMPPADAHLARGMQNTATAELPRHIFHQATAIVIVKPVFEIMQPRKVIAGALSAAIAIRFDVIQQALGNPI